jgi:hypothetical protein
MPAVQFQEGVSYMGWKAGWDAIQTIPSFYLDWSSFLGAILGTGNIFAAIAPAALFFSTKRPFKFLSVFSVVVFIIALSVFFFGEDYAEGYFLWVASFLGTATGFGMLSAAVAHNKSPHPSGSTTG